MASYVAKKASRKFLGNKAAQIEPQDPHYETYEDARGKQRKRKRAMPQGLSKRDERVLVSPARLTLSPGHETDFVSLFQRSVRRRAHCELKLVVLSDAERTDLFRSQQTSTKASRSADSGSDGRQDWD